MFQSHKDRQMINWLFHIHPTNACRKQSLRQKDLPIISSPLTGPTVEHLTGRWIAHLTREKLLSSSYREKK